MPHRVIIAPIVAAAVRQGPEDAARAASATRSPAAGRSQRSFNFQSGFPIGVVAEQLTPPARQRAAAEPRPGVDLGDAPAIWPDRLALGRSPDGDVDQPRGVHRRGAAGTFGNAPRHDHRCPHAATQSTPTLSVSKNFRFGGSKSAQIKIEVMNLFNRVQTNGPRRRRRGNSRSARSTRKSGSCG